MRRRHERGMVLLAVLFFVLLASAGVATFLSRAVVDGMAASNRDAAARAEALARGGVRLATAALLQDLLQEKAEEFEADTSLDLKYADQTVSVSGDVRDTFGLGALKYYTVTDRTGSIRVMTERPLPKQGEHIRVTGRVEEAFSFGSQTSVVLVEEKPKK